MSLNPELLKKARGAKSAEELISLAKENGLNLTEESAKILYAKNHQETELEDSELDNVSGGCGGGSSSSNDDDDYPLICPNCGSNALVFWLTDQDPYINGDIYVCVNCGRPVEYDKEDHKWIIINTHP